MSGQRFYGTKYGLPRGYLEPYGEDELRRADRLTTEWRAEHGWPEAQSPLARGHFLTTLSDMARERVKGK